ncbi:hypothetical protein MMC12_002768 [Toensbergia leucococca]|nr:hypothetical protein [Toensbergia leucococca]
MLYKKRKREPDPPPNDEINTSKPTAVFKPSSGRAYTLSIALPGSIIANAQSPSLQTLLAGQIARALAVFCVDEVIVFSDTEPKHQPTTTIPSSPPPPLAENDPNYFLLHLLSYLETPPYLRKPLFPLHPNLSTAGALPSLDMPHHLRGHEWCQYREGITIPQPAPPKSTSQNAKKTQKHSSVSIPTTLIDAGLAQKISIPTPLPPSTRVTLQFPSETQPPLSEPLTATAVAPSTPRTTSGYYWGYTTRFAHTLSTIFTESPFPHGYNLTFGTSERGVPLASILHPDSKKPPIPQFDHMLIVFGGVAGLEAAVAADAELQGLGVREPGVLFDYWVDLCPGQGSRTVRTEEAVWIGLMGLREVVVGKGRR